MQRWRAIFELIDGQPVASMVKTGGGGYYLAPDVDAKIAELQSQMVRIYNLGYHAGHEATVEGGYTHIYPCDMDTYHAEEVQELLEELKGDAP